MPQTAPVSATTTGPAASSVALLFVKVNGQFTPPWPTRPLADQLIVEPDSVPEPDPVTVMLPAHVPAKVTFALDAAVGVTVYFTLPHPVGGVDGVIEAHVPANASSDVAGPVGEVGEDDGLFFVKRAHAGVSAHASAKAAAAARSFIDPPYRQYDF